MAHVLSKTLRNAASHEKITMPWVPTPKELFAITCLVCTLPF